MSEEMKACACHACGEPPFVWVDDGRKWVQCVNPKCWMAELDGQSLEAWNSRPLEDTLRARAETAEAEVDRLVVALEKIIAVKDHSAFGLSQSSDIYRMGEIALEALNERI